MGRPRSFDDDVVIERAMEVFWTHGYANTSPAHLADATGIAKGSLYNAFNSKRELFDRALARYDEQVSELAGELLSRPGPTRECLRAALRFIVDLDRAQQSPRGCLVGNTAVELAGHDPQVARTIRAMQDRQTAALTARIEQGQRAGDVGPEVDARAIAEFLATTLAGLRVMAMTHEAPTLHRVIDSALAALG
ncbi:TetR/AcrR family transcriptional regulator [Lapillicoccus sp.]|uniref:TetR/AcrR family transcriptional regulator n=1 Tax=Lapillicoccus sp. TaxID=1909287 RepID=UPI0025DCB7B0|nr:TetR/AcrR family transcriptional regulator [Lapillicoccus sp.]